MLLDTIHPYMRSQVMRLADDSVVNGWKNPHTNLSLKSFHVVYVPPLPSSSAILEYRFPFYMKLKDGSMASLISAAFPSERGQLLEERCDEKGSNCHGLEHGKTPVMRKCTKGNKNLIHS